MVRISFKASVSSLQGKAAEHAPELESKESPSCGEFTTTTSEALVGPLFCTVIVYVPVVPGVTRSGPTIWIARCASVSVTALTMVALLLLESGSGVEDETLAVFWMLFWL